ncbi:MAG TPA: efflux RND transporter periplasmic adaptor subunit [Gemmatimonadales bacterium]|nr:efflux RND transporter periplasmic adaptor subunit [Gemmatimonadales bacterium]
MPTATCATPASPRLLSRHFVLLAVGLAAACGEDAAPQAQAGAPGGPERPIPVEIAVAELGTAARTVTATGTIEPIRTVTINSQLAGAVRQVAVEEGIAVRQGTLLARIDSRELEAQLASAEANLQAAERAAERAERLRSEEIITVAEYERDIAAHAAARATRDQLRTRVGHATVRSPIAGVVLSKSVEMGDIVGTQTQLFTIGDVSSLVARLPISELDVTALDEGDEVSLTLDALPGRTLPGRIRRIFPSGDPTTRLVPVEVVLTGAAAREARPGFLARVRFQLDPRSGVLMVPAGALVDDAGGSAAFLIGQGRARRRPVERGEIYQGRVEITQGLAVGDTVAVAGVTTLRDGAQVRIVDAPSLVGPEAGQTSAGGRAAPAATAGDSR